MKRSSLLILLFAIQATFLYAQTTLTLKPSGAAGKDSHIQNLYPNDNRGNYVLLGAQAWTSGGKAFIVRGLTQFDLSGLPAGAIIIQAKLSLYHVGDDSYIKHESLTGSNAGYLQRITSNWDENTVNWNNQPSTTIDNQVALAESIAPDQDYLNINVTNLVKDMVNNPSSSFGFMLRLQTESQYRSLSFAASDEPNAALHPELKITYTMNTNTDLCYSTGKLTREQWNNVKGYDVRQIPVNTPPSSKGEITSFMSPSNIGDSYGARVSGYVCPPVSGNYTFWIATDDNGALFLSSDDQPANKKRIAWVNGATSPLQWNKYASQQSVPVYLEAHTKYYIEALHKEAAGNDHLEVGWQLPNGTLERPIAEVRLSPMNANTARTSELVEEPKVFTASPNPFSDKTTITFLAQQTEQASISLHSISGTLLKTLFTGEVAEGESKMVSVNANSLQPGIYLIQLTTPSKTSFQKVIVIQ